ncbi:glycoside hydrolase family 5 protein [Maribacter sp. R77961]|uniref:glycoside hydrolase family 5 protein n=1 Tax=Maribacter sp. R77961 TaxID=3093871 RepID=UPI0037C9E8C4
MRKIVAYLLILVLFSSCSKERSSITIIPADEVIDREENNSEEELELTTPFLRVDNTRIVDGSQNNVKLQGVAFGNFIWTNTPTPAPHHTEEDFKRVKAMGMNTIRFYLHYIFFEDDANPYTYKQAGWDWLDQNIEWAKKHDVYLILNMHAPQGGYQSQGNGDALWDLVENQNRLVALWQAIAERYKYEDRIAGFGPVNEPVPTQDMNQWSELAQKLVDGIREVDKNHPIFLERAIYVKGTNEVDENFNFPQVNGSGIVYEFHEYTPYFYTHQLLDFANLGDGGRYPDENALQVQDLNWYTASFNNPTIPAGNTDWTFYEGQSYLVDDPKVTVALPALVGANTGDTVFFDDIIIKEYNEDGIFVRNVYESGLDSFDGWSFWSANQSGTAGLSTTEGNSSNTSLFIKNSNSDANISNFAAMFEPRQGHSYQINGWMKGERISNTSNCTLRIDFYTSNSPIQKRNKSFLESTILPIVNWSKENNVPLYMGEFGAGTPCFANNKGGLLWVEDMVDILNKYDIPFTYHSYHEDSFGLYLGFGLPEPTNVNQPLIDWFTNNLN